MKSEMERLMENIKEGQPCPANCGGTIEIADYSNIGAGTFLQCSHNGPIHYRRISPPNPKKPKP